MRFGKSKTRIDDVEGLQADPPRRTTRLTHLDHALHRRCQTGRYQRPRRECKHHHLHPMTRNSPRMKMMMFAFAPRALITACLAASVKSVIQVSETSSAAGRVNLKTLNIINSRFGLAKSQSEPVLDVPGFHSTFARILTPSKLEFERHWCLQTISSCMFVE